MLKVTLRLVIALQLAADLLGPPLLAQGSHAAPTGSLGQGRKCATKTLSSEAYVRAADSLEVAQGRSALRQGYPQLEGASLDVSVGAGCVKAVAVNWDGELAGGLLVLDAADRVLWSDPSYHGARDLLDAGPNRVLLTYTANKGSGLYESRYVVLCALRSDAWVQCFDAVARKLDIVSGSVSSDSATSELMMEQLARVSIRGDTILLNRRVRYRREGDTQPRDVSLGVARIVLPR
jgi:hypothetical protein